MRWALCNGNPQLKWQSGSMVKVNANLSIVLIVSSLKKKLKLHLGRWVNTASNRNDENLLVLGTEENINS